ncbi:hypothetical protein PC123_g15564 [Phytophthora cactorum]|nr:hypothetical protein PC123_g15564 [Phytophthora cactorum]
MSCLFNGFVNDQHLAALGALNERQQMLHSDDEAVFKDQAVRAENALLEMDKILLRPAYKDPMGCSVDTFFENCGNTKAFVLESNMTLPFVAQVTANAVWKVMTTDKMKYHCYEHRVAYKSDTVVSQAFGIHFITDVSDADFRCK